MQYAACTVLGYSLAEYRCMTFYEIVRQSEIHAEAMGRTVPDNVDEDGVSF